MLSKYTPYNHHSIQKTSYWNLIPEELREGFLTTSHVLPFRTNEYVMNELINWENIPNDPIYRLTFLHGDMLLPDEYQKLKNLILTNNKDNIQQHVNQIRIRMNPHPAGQMTHNVPMLDGIPVQGIQHKYKETVLFFPSAGQTCHAYCTFCFRWPQFVKMDDMKIHARDLNGLIPYLKRHKEVTDVLITGGDPMIMNTNSLKSYIEPLLQPDLAHIQNIRIGTKSVAYWPHRFVSDNDSDELLRLFESVVKSEKNLAIMGHYSHPVELSTQVAQKAVKRILSTGARVWMQSPVIRHINENPKDWASLWTTCVNLGAIPYYMFVERDTGPSHYFRLPLVKAYEIFQSAYQLISGLARTVRGPSMSAFPGKIVIDGVVDIQGEKLFALQFLQARNPDWVRRPFYAKYDETATWLDDLKPAFGEKKFFYE